MKEEQQQLIVILLLKIIILGSYHNHGLSQTSRRRVHFKIIMLFDKNTYSISK